MKDRSSDETRADYLVTTGTFTTEHARLIAEALVRRHASAPLAKISLPDVETLILNHSIAAEAIAHDTPELSTAELRLATRHQAEILRKRSEQLVLRQASGRALESAASLELDAVWFGPTLDPAADGVRIESPASSQPGDVCVELTGLSVALLAAGRVDAAEALVSHYAGQADDFALYELVNYYEFSTALARAAVSAHEAARARDHEERESAFARARRLVAIALSSDRRPEHPPFVVAVGGQVASGKSTLARALADRLSVPHVIADRVRDQLLHGAPGHEIHESHWAKSFEPGFRGRVYAELIRRAEMTLESGRGVVLDGCFARASDRAAARTLASAHGVPFRFVEVRISDEVRKSRLALRDAADRVSGWQQIADDLASDWEASSELVGDEVRVLDGDESIEENVARVVSALPAWPDPARPGAPFPVLRRALPRPPAAVTFDCWNTLIYEADWERAHARRVNALERASREAGRRTTRAEASAAFDVGWENQMACWRDGIRSGAREVAIHALSELGLHEPHPALEHLIREYEEASHSGQVLAIDGARECLEDLARRGIRRALVCDTGLTPGRVVRQHLERLGLLEHLEVCIFSDEIGAPKPDARAFSSALDPLGVEPDLAIHVGDLRRTDVAGARAFGMATVRIRGQHDDKSSLPDADAIVDSHAELIETLRESS